MPLARVGQRELVQPMVERHTLDRDRHLARIREVRQSLPSRLMRLSEVHFVLLAFQCAPGADPPLQRAQHARRQSTRMLPLQFLEDRHRGQARSASQ
jgi:hypothetical protein